MYVEKNSENQTADDVDRRVNQLLSESEQAIKQGNRQRAYELSVQATKMAPENLEAWFLRATLASSLEERLFCVNCLNELSPDRQDKHHVAFSAVKELLDKDPFLAYLEETEALYRVVNKSNQVVVIPKKRAAINVSVPERSSPLKTAYSLLVISIFGLMLAGVGTLIFAPLSALAALQAGRSLHSHAERVSLTIVLILDGLFFVLGLFFAYLFALHLVG